MDSINGQASYWCRVAVRAFDDALTALGINRRKAVLGVITTSIAAGVFAYLFGTDKAADKLMWAGLTLGAFWGLFLFVYSFFLLRTPYRLHSELRVSCESQIETLRASLDGLESQKASLSDEVAKARTSNPNDNFRRNELEKLITRFRQLVSRL